MLMHGCKQSQVTEGQGQGHSPQALPSVISQQEDNRSNDTQWPTLTPCSLPAMPETAQMPAHMPTCPQSFILPCRSILTCPAVCGGHTLVHPYKPNADHSPDRKHHLYTLPEFTCVDLQKIIFIGSLPPDL